MSVRQCTSAYDPRIRAIALVDHTKEHDGALKKPFSLHVDLDAMPDWQRNERLTGWGRTFWCLALAA